MEKKSTQNTHKDLVNETSSDSHLESDSFSELINNGQKKSKRELRAEALKSLLHTAANKD